VWLPSQKLLQSLLDNLGKWAQVRGV